MSENNEENTIFDYIGITMICVLVIIGLITTVIFVFNLFNDDSSKSEVSTDYNRTERIEVDKPQATSTFSISSSFSIINNENEEETKKIKKSKIEAVKEGIKREIALNNAIEKRKNICTENNNGSLEEKIIWSDTIILLGLSQIEDIIYYCVVNGIPYFLQEDNSWMSESGEILK